MVKLLDLPPHLRERLASALESGLLPSVPTEVNLLSVLGNFRPVGTIIDALKELARLGASGKVAAQWIRSLERIEARAAKTDMVWSGPPVQGLHARETRMVYEELLGSAKRSLLVSTFVFFDGPNAFASLARRMEAVPELRVVLLLNIMRRGGDTAPANHVVRRFTDRFWKVEWPGKSRPKVFYDPRALDPAHPSGVLHAKAVVADEEKVFVTSANLTEAAFERNIELGLLVRDRALAASVSAHFHALICRGLLSLLPAE